MKTFYEVLGISEKAESDEIINAYKNLKNKHELETNNLELLKQVELAYKVLGDSENKKKYDNDLKNMRQDEQFRVLKQNTQEYNKKIEDEQRIKLQERMKQQEELNKSQIDENELDKIVEDAFNNEIQKNKKIDERKNKDNSMERKSVENENLEELRKKLAKEYERQYKQAKKEEKIYRQNHRSSFEQTIRTIIASIIVLGGIYLILKIPFVRNWIVDNIVSFFNIDK